MGESLFPTRVLVAMRSAYGVSVPVDRFNGRLKGWSLVKYIHYHAVSDVFKPRY